MNSERVTQIARGFRNGSKFVASMRVTQHRVSVRIDQGDQPKELAGITGKIASALQVQRNGDASPLAPAYSVRIVSPSKRSPRRLQVSVELPGEAKGERLIAVAASVKEAMLAQFRDQGLTHPKFKIVVASDAASHAIDLPGGHFQEPLDVPTGHKALPSGRITTSGIRIAGR